MPKLKDVKNNFYYLFAILFMASSCHENVEGCLDIEATSFDFEADVNCCCEYPSFVLNYDYKQTANSETQFRKDLVLSSNAKPFYLVSAVFALTNFRLVSGNDTLTVNENINLTSLENEENLSLRTDFVVVDNNSFSEDLGMFTRNITSYDKLLFDVGFSDVQKKVDPEFLTSSDAQFSNQDELFDMDNQTWNDYYFAVTTDTADITDTVSIAGTLQETLTFEFTNPIDLEIRNDVSLNLRINYLDILNGLDPESVNNNVLNNLIQSNLVMSLDIE